MYITEEKAIVDYLSLFTFNFFPRMITQVFLFIIMGSVLVLISWHLIMSIANNILAPVRNLKNLINGLNHKSNSNNTINSIRDLEDKHKITGRESNRDIANYDNNKGKKGSKNLFDDGSEYIEEEITLYRSVEMDKLFNILLELKNVLSFTSSKQYLFENNYVLLNYINANYSFREVKNDKGKL